MTITLRDIPPEVLRKLQARAKSAGVSLAKTVLKTLAESPGTRSGKQPVLHHDLDHFDGTWSKKEAATFEKALRAQRQIDPGPWSWQWIAASAMQHGLRLVTTDDHFRRVPHVLVACHEVE
jgi:predicted nucleic acid-binding protein